MASCVNCGRETGQGQFFCPECFAAMTPERGVKPSEEAGRPLEEKELPEDAREVPVEGKAPPPTGKEQAAPEVAAEPSGKKIDVVRSSVLTPSSEKKTIRPTPALPEKKKKTLRDAVRKAARKAEPAKPAVQETAPDGTAVKAGRRRSGRLAGLSGKIFVKPALWVWGLATKEGQHFSGKGWMAPGLGMAASLALLVAVLFLGFIRFEWMFAELDPLITETTEIKAIELGAWGYVLLACAVVMLLLFIWSTLGPRLNLKTRINPSFLAICACFIGLLAVLIMVGSDGLMIDAVAGKNEYLPEVFESAKLAYADKVILAGAYVSLISLVIAFMAAASCLASDKTKDKRLSRILARIKTRRFTEGKHSRRKGGNAAGPSTRLPGDKRAT